VSPRDDGVLHVDDKERGIRPFRQRGHGLCGYSRPRA
jgi:hypothetical protein